MHHRAVGIELGVRVTRRPGPCRVTLRVRVICVTLDHTDQHVCGRGYRLFKKATEA